MLFFWSYNIHAIISNILFVDHCLILEAGVHDRKLHDLLLLAGNVWSGCLLQGLNLFNRCTAAAVS
jgi:hypothetical protein